MKTRHALAALCGALAITTATAQASWAGFIQAAAPDGTVIVNQKNGNVTYCVSAVTSTINKGTPTGKCAKIGVASPSLLSGLVDIATAGASAFITNLDTGEVLHCALTSLRVLNSSTPTGICIGAQAQ